jgi:hypothetical protein
MNFESSGAKFFARLLRTLASYFDAASSPLKLEEEEEDEEEEEEEKNAAKHRSERSKAIVHSARTRTILASHRWGEKDEDEDFLSFVARGKEVLLDVPRREVVVVVVGNISNLCLQSVFQFFSRVVGDMYALIKRLARLISREF